MDFKLAQKEFDKNIDQLQSLSNNELTETYNYKKSQIEAIRSFDYTDEMRIKASASARINHYKINFYDNGGRTYFSYGMEGNVNGLTYSKSISFAMTARGSSSTLMFNGSDFALNYHMGGFRHVFGGERNITQGLGNVWTVSASQAIDGQWQRVTSFSGRYNAVGDLTNTVGIQSAVGHSKLSANFGFGLSTDGGYGVSINPVWSHYLLNKVTSTLYK